MAGKQGEVAGEGVWRNALRNLHGALLHGASDEAAARDALRAQPQLVVRERARDDGAAARGAAQRVHPDERALAR